MNELENAAQGQDEHEQIVQAYANLGLTTLQAVLRTRINGVRSPH